MSDSEANLALDDESSFAQPIVDAALPALEPLPAKKKKKKKKKKSATPQELPEIDDETGAFQSGGVTESKGFEAEPEPVMEVAAEDAEEAASPKKKKKKKKKKKRKTALEDAEEDEQAQFAEQDGFAAGGESIATVNENGDTVLTVHGEEDEEPVPDSDNENHGVESKAAPPAKSFMDRFRRKKNAAEEGDDGSDTPDEEQEEEEEEGRDDADILKAKEQKVSKEEAEAIVSLPFITYFSNDPIENLRLKVTVRPAPPDDLLRAPVTHKGMHLLMKSQDNINVTDSSGNKSKILDGLDRTERKGGSDSEDEEAKKPEHDPLEGEQSMIFSWQQKKFTAREILSYVRDRQRPDTQLAAKYAANIKQDVLGLSEKESEDTKGAAVKLAQEHVERLGGFAVGSYVEGDGYINPAEYLAFATTSKRTTQNPVAKLVLDQKRQKGMQRGELDYESMYVVASVDMKKGQHIQTLNKWSKTQKYGSEVILCEVRAYGNGTFECAPGFSPAERNSAVDESNNSNNNSSSNQSHSGRSTQASQMLSTIVSEDQTNWFTFVAPKSKLKYWYRIENLSHPPEDEVLNKTMQQDARLRALMITEDDPTANGGPVFNADFEASPEQQGELQLNCFGEIVSAFGFEGEDDNNLYIEYELWFNGRWTWGKNDRFHRQRATTQTSRVMQASPMEGQGVNTPGEGLQSATADTEVAHFSFPFEFELNGREGHIHTPEQVDPEAVDELLKTKKRELRKKLAYEKGEVYVSDDEADDVDAEDADLKEDNGPHLHDPPLQYPMMYFQVSSVDSWGRHRVVGYGYTRIPSKPGSHTRVLKTWRPVGSVRDQMDRFFVGGSESLRDLKLAGGPLTGETMGMGLGMGVGFERGLTHAENTKSYFLNKSGWKSETSGSIKIRFNTIQIRHNPDEHRMTSFPRALDKWKPLLRSKILGGSRHDKTTKRVNKLRSAAHRVGQKNRSSFA